MNDAAGAAHANRRVRQFWLLVVCSACGVLGGYLILKGFAEGRLGRTPPSVVFGSVLLALGFASAVSFFCLRTVVRSDPWSIRVPAIVLELIGAAGVVVSLFFAYSFFRVW